MNNRQNGRRRGRGGQRPQGLGGGGGGGNGREQRSRGNAAQLLEKYKNMARDAQLGGDRVQSEYYLQFAEHYYRMLGESRARFEEQRRQRGDDSGSDEDDDEEMMDASEEQQEQHQQHEQHEQRPQRDQRPRRSDSRSDSRSGSRSNGSRPESDNDDEERIALEVLPPSIGRDEGDGGDEVELAKPKRRARRPRPDDGDDEVAPAA